MKPPMRSVSSEIQRAISEAINEQKSFTQKIQATVRSGKEQMFNKEQNVPTGRLEIRTEEAFNRKCRSSTRDEFPRDLNGDVDEEDTR